VTGAGLHLEGMFPASSRFSSFVPQSWADARSIAVSRAWFGLSGSNLAIVTACAAGRHRRALCCWPGRWAATRPLLAQIITLQTILAAITMPIAIAVAAAQPKTYGPIKKETGDVGGRMNDHGQPGSSYFASEK